MTNSLPTIDRDKPPHAVTAKAYIARQGKSLRTIDANEAVARVAYLLNEVIALYPITPATPMGEWADRWAAEGRKNLWGTVPSVIEMQSEAGAAGALHGALQTGSLGTTFTASQGLLLMIPNMYKIAGELTPAVFHIAARTVASHALSIFGDHSDVMAARATGWAMLAGASVQEAQDFALISQAATLNSRIPFLHFFDGFRTSHEIAKIEILGDETIRAMIDEKRIFEHRARALSPDHPVLRGTAQNADVFFQGREASNLYYLLCSQIVQATMDRFAELTGRQYRIFDYHGDPVPERVIILMGSGCETVQEAVDYLNQRGEHVGVLKVRLFRPFDSKAFVEALPHSAKSIAVLDRTKEPGSAGEPLLLDCIRAIFDDGRSIRVAGGRYGLSSKEFTPAMAIAIFEDLKREDGKSSFTIGITDDVTGKSLEYDSSLCIEPDDVYRAIFFGLGSDGTVGANKESIRIIGENTGHYAQGYFVYDSKKAGTMTTSHLRFGPRPIHSPYLISKAHFVACHQPILLDRVLVTEALQSGGTLLLNSPHNADQVWENLPHALQCDILTRHLRLFVIDAHKIARDCGIDGRINTVMEACFFEIAHVLPPKAAIAEIKSAIRKSYSKKGMKVVQMNLRAVDCALAQLQEVRVPNRLCTRVPAHEPIPLSAPPFVRGVIEKIIDGHGNDLCVSEVPVDGTFPTGTARWEKRNLAFQVPMWRPDICIQCGKCVVACPHAAIRSKVFELDSLGDAPPTFKTEDARLPEWKGLRYSLQVAVEDCTGCAICADVCPVRDREDEDKALIMTDKEPILKEERHNWDFFTSIPERKRQQLEPLRVREVQVQQPYFEFSGACAGCGETPYIKLLTQLFGDRLIVANATGCSSIYGGNLPTTPWSKNEEGRGPAWSNSLFEDNAEFGLGFRVSLDKQRTIAAELLISLMDKVGNDLVYPILSTEQLNEREIQEQRDRVSQLKEKLESIDSNKARRLLAVADALVRKSVWIIGGDGWGYDIGFGGLDHVLASGANVKVLLLDTEVYSNTGGQCSKATPRGAHAKFASGGKPTAKKDLGLMAMSYGTVYVASVALGANDEHTLKCFREAEEYNGPALILAYSHCIAHGIAMSSAMQHQKDITRCGQWLLYRFDPSRIAQGENPLQIDSKPPQIPIADVQGKEHRFQNGACPNLSSGLLSSQAQHDVDQRWQMYEYLAQRTFPKPPTVEPNAE